MTLNFKAEMLELIMDNLNEGVIGLDKAGSITYVNQAAAKSLGYMPQGMIGEAMHSLFHDCDAEKQSYSWANSPIGIACRGGRPYASENEYFNSLSGKDFPVAYSCIPLRAAQEDGTRMFLVFQDITLKRMTENYMRHVAHHDPMTGLGNRQLFKTMVEKAFARASRHDEKMGLLYLDLNGFKPINDELGHDVGDGLLIEVANRLTRCLRESDNVARMGGDEFTLIVEDLQKPADITFVAERVVQAIAKPFNIHGHDITIATSVGIAIYPDDGDSMEILVKQADEAMYKAKRAKVEGGSYRFANPALNRKKKSA